MKLYVSEHVTNITSKLSIISLQQLKEATNIISSLPFTELLHGRYNCKKVESTANIYIFNYSHLNIYIAYLEHQNFIILVDLLNNNAFIERNLEFRNDRVFPKEWVEETAYFIAEQNGFKNNPINDWFSAKKFLLSLFNIK